MTSTEIQSFKLQGDDLSSLAYTAGVYCIEHLDGRAYVGSTSDLRRRCHSHISHLKHGRHPSKELQLIYDRGGPDKLLIKILEIVRDKSTLEKREQYWITAKNAFNGFNIAPARSRKMTSLLPTGYQLRAARAVLDLTLRDLARALRVSQDTIMKIEQSGRVNASTISTFTRFYEDRGFKFTENEDHVGMRWPRRKP